MGEHSRDMNFPDEPLGTYGSRVRGIKDLDGNLTIVLQVMSEVHAAHPARTDMAQDGVPFA
jgi:hypothetical protein